LLETLHFNRLTEYQHPFSLNKAERSQRVFYIGIRDLSKLMLLAPGYRIGVRHDDSY